MNSIILKAWTSADIQIRALKGKIEEFRKEERGITMLEYGILAALITALSIPTIALIGPKLKAAFDSINAELK